MKIEFLNQVRAFVADYWGEWPSRLFAETSVNCDLGMDGDDGVEFMDAFSVRFGVDLTEFPHDNYFGPEGMVTPISLIDAFIARLTTGRWTRLAPLTLRQLAEAAENGRWVESRRETS